ncbi:hypothetical protein FQZ97_873230 [compost metagenome]
MAGNRFAITALSFSSEPVQEIGTISDFAEGLLEGLALLGGHNDRQIVRMLTRQSCPATQQRATLNRRNITPGLERLSGCVYSLIDPGFFAMGDLGDDFIGSGISHCQTGFTLNPLPIYIGTLFQEVWAAQLLESCSCKVLHFVGLGVKLTCFYGSHSRNQGAPPFGVV